MYKQFVSKGDLQNKYLKFCEIYHAIVLLKTFYLKKKEKEKELSPSEETSSDKFDYEKEILSSQKPL